MGGEFKKDAHSVLVRYPCHGTCDARSRWSANPGAGGDRAEWSTGSGGTGTEWTDHPVFARRGGADGACSVYARAGGSPTNTAGLIKEMKGMKGVEGVLCGVEGGLEQ